MTNSKLTILPLLLSVDPSKGPDNEKKRWLWTLVSRSLLALTFSMALWPYVLFLKNETGHWTFTKKSAVIIGGLAQYSDAKKQHIAEIHEHFRADNEKQKVKTALSDSGHDLRALLMKRPMLMAQKCFHGLYRCLQMLQCSS